ncbi:hypothetical protein RB201_04560 [Streptomyces sp. S1A(2023)]
MTNEIATRDEQAVAIPAPQPTNELMEWVESARQANLVAQSLANTSFAGAYRGKPDEITAAILTGQELGLQPMTALKSIDVIQGQPALRAHAMRAIVQHQGHDIELVESTPTHCVMRGRRKGGENWQQVEWDIPRAHAAGTPDQGPVEEAAEDDADRPRHRGTVPADRVGRPSRSAVCGRGSRRVRPRRDRPGEGPAQHRRPHFGPRAAGERPHPLWRGGRRHRRRAHRRPPGAPRVRPAAGGRRHRGPRPRRTRGPRRARLRTGHTRPCRTTPRRRRSLTHPRGRPARR